MNDFLKYLPIATVILFSIGAFRMVIFGNRYRIPLSNYLNFSNLLSYTFDVIHGLLYSAIPVVIFIVGKEEWKSFLLKISPYIYLLISSLSALSVWYFYKIRTLTLWGNFILKYVVELGLFSIGIYIKTKWIGADFELIKLSLAILFIFFYLKINSKFEFDEMKILAKKSMTKITFKDGQIWEFSDKIYIVSNTPDFVFVKNDLASSFTVLSMSDIRSIATTSIL